MNAIDFWKDIFLQDLLPIVDYLFFFFSGALGLKSGSESSALPKGPSGKRDCSLFA